MLNLSPSLSSLFERSDVSPFNFKTRPFQPSNSGFNEQALNAPERDNFQLFNKLLQSAYDHIATQFGNPVNQNITPATTSSNGPVYQEGFIPVDKISSEQAANTILDFISGRLKSDFAEGASQEELIARLEQGLQGFVKGFNEAKGTLESLGLLTPQLSEEINDTYQRVTDGIESFRGIINDKFDQPVDSVSSLQRLDLSAQTASSASFSLDLITQDGDKVTIDIAQNNSASFSSSFTQSNGGFSLVASTQQSSSSQFNLTVQGELDEEELIAINQLLQDIDSIAVDFYQGDLDAAFASAQELELDRDELSSMNLELQQTVVTSAIASYQTISEQPAASPISELDQLIGRIEDLFADVKNFDFPHRLVNDAAKGIDQIEATNFGAENSGGFTDLIGELISQFDL